MKIFKSNNNQDGAAVVEFAIVFPLLLFLLFGIIEFSLLFYNKAMLTNASREGARLGIVFAAHAGPDGIFGTSDDTTHPTDTDIKQRVIDYAKNNLITFGSDILTDTDITVTRSGTSSGDVLTCTVSFQYNFLIVPNLATFFGGAFSNLQNLTAVTKMRLE